jgi:Zn-dependent peptidase ImmA (M78 family)
MTLGHKIRQRRLSLGYSLDDLKHLIDELGHSLSKAAISKYELNKSIPKATNLWYIAQALGTSAEFFLRETTFSINWIAFRKTSRLPKKEASRIQFIAREQVEAQLFLSDLLFGRMDSMVIPSYQVNAIEDAEAAADKLRSDWKLGNWPIDSVTGLLEDKSVFIIDVDRKDGFDGLSGFADDERPLIVTAQEGSVDRKRLNIAHELAHLILKVRGVDEEKAAFRFAGALLAPAQAVIGSIGKRRNRIDIRELVLLKEEYGISVQALIRRCFDLKIVSEYEYRNLNVYMRSRGLHLDEPGECYHKETPTMIKSKLLRAISEGFTTESEIISRFPTLSAEIGGVDIEDKWLPNSEKERKRFLEESAANMAREYYDGGALTGLDIYDEIVDGK